MKRNEPMYLYQEDALWIVLVTPCADVCRGSAQSLYSFHQKYPPDVFRSARYAYFLCAAPASPEVLIVSPTNVHLLVCRSACGAAFPSVSTQEARSRKMAALSNG
eukprot:gene16856-biopygen12835